MTIEELERYAAQADERLNRLLLKLRKDLKAKERAVFVGIAEYLQTFDTDDEGVSDSTRNFTRLAALAPIIEEVAQRELAPVIANFADELLKALESERAYFEALGFSDEQVRAAFGDFRLVRSRLGLELNGRFTAGSFLDLVARVGDLVARIRDKVVQAMATRQPLQNMLNGISKMLRGDRQTTGAIVGSIESALYDVPNQVREINNLRVARDLELRHFVYTGGLIETSRKFCQKRNRKAYSIDETKNWKNDPDLIDKKTKETYNPIIERGRYNCRHFLMWITPEQYQELKAKEA